MGQLLSLLLLVGFVLHYFWWIAAAAAVVMAVKCAPRVWERHQAAVEAWKAEQRALVARADQQHAPTLAGDPRGTYATNPRSKRDPAVFVNRIALASVYQVFGPPPYPHAWWRAEP
jgi:hypothetical protein